MDGPHRPEPSGAPVARRPLPSMAQGWGDGPRTADWNNRSRDLSLIHVKTGREFTAAVRCNAVTRPRPLASIVRRPAPPEQRHADEHQSLSEAVRHAGARSPAAVQSVEPLIPRHAGAVSCERAWAQDADGGALRLISRQAGGDRFRRLATA